MEPESQRISPPLPIARALSAPASYPFPADPRQMLTWSHVQQRLEQARYFWLATVRPDGRPHVTPLWGVWLDSALFFDGPPFTRWARNLAAQPSVSVHLDDGNDVVILEGTVEDLTVDAELGNRIISAWSAKYGALQPDPSGGGILRVRPRSVRAWSTEGLTDGARWIFPR